MDTVTEELLNKRSSPILSNDTALSTTNYYAKNILQSNLDEEDQSKKSDKSSTTPLLVVSSPDDEFSEKLTKLSPAPAYTGGVSGTVHAFIFLE